LHHGKGGDRFPSFDRSSSSTGFSSGGGSFFDGADGGESGGIFGRFDRPDTINLNPEDADDKDANEA
jgi:hypothetical protein